MDDADRAQIRIEQDEEIRRKQREARTVSLVESRDNCVECGLEIPSARQIAIPGVETCIDCQSHFRDDLQ